MDVNLLPLLPATQVLVDGVGGDAAAISFSKKTKKGSWLGSGFWVWCSAAVETMLLWGSQDGAFGDTLLLDNFALFFTQIFLGAAGADDSRVDSLCKADAESTKANSMP